jgi:hypothetical protein
LPPGNLTDDVGAIYRSMWHKHPIVNGYSGYNPPHYLPFVFAIRDRDYSVLRELSPSAPLGVAIRRSGTETPSEDEALRRLAGATTGPPSAAWATFVVPPHRPPRQPVGPPIAVVRVSANRFVEDVSRITDGSVETAWHGAADQIGDEELVVDLGAPRTIGAVVLGMGAFAFGFPRDLRIDSSLDGREWTPAWRGATATLTVRAAVNEPTVVPLTIEVGRVPARFLRLQQLGTEPGIPWWVPELRVHAPPADPR